MIDRLREVNRNAKQQADLASKETDSSPADDDDDFALEQDEIMRVARQIEQIAKSLQKMEASYRGIVEDQVDLICRYKSNGFLTFTNSSYSKFLGKKRSERVGQRFPIFDLGYPKRNFQGNLPDRALFEVELVPIDSADTVSYQWTHRAIKSYTGTILEYQAVGHDISDRKAAQAALIEAKEAAESAESVDRAKSEFLAVVSHEVRTPINAVIGFSKLLRDSPLTKNQDEYVSNIHQSGVSLEGLVADILDVSRLEAGQLEIEHSPFSPRESINDLTEYFAAAVKKATLKLTMKVDSGVPIFINGDQTTFRQLLMNFVDNAIKFTERGGVDVKINCARSSEVDSEGLCGLRLFVEVADTGIGIPANRITELFKPFNQMDSSSTRRRGGTGLGLVISKRLCELMGGAISVDSTPGVGSTFRFSLALSYQKGDSQSPIEYPNSNPGLPPSSSLA